MTMGRCGCGLCAAAAGFRDEVGRVGHEEEQEEDGSDDGGDDSGRTKKGRMREDAIVIEGRVAEGRGWT